MVRPVVDIAMDGPGGSVVYRAAGHEHRFDGELNALGRFVGSFRESA